MVTVLLVVYVLVAFSMIVIILLQRSEGGALGMGGGGGGLVTGRGAANFLTKLTTTLAAIFFATALALGIFLHRPKPPSGMPASAPQGTPVSGSAIPGTEQAPATAPSLKMPKAKTETAPAPSPAPAAPAQPELPQSQ